jgi:hypothetical protein
MGHGVLSERRYKPGKKMRKKKKNPKSQHKSPARRFLVLQAHMYDGDDVGHWKGTIEAELQAMQCTSTHTYPHS